MLATVPPTGNNIEPLLVRLSPAVDAGTLLAVTWPPSTLPKWLLFVGSLDIGKLLAVLLVAMVSAPPPPEHWEEGWPGALESVEPDGLELLAGV